jgi:HK97 family phage portal protein
VVQKANGRREVLDNDVRAWLLNASPDGELTGFTFREHLVAHALLWGNGYAEIQRDMSERPAALALLTPDRVRPRRDDAGRLYYEVHQAAGAEQIAARDMVHLRGLGWDGSQGYSVVSQAQQSLGLTAAMETFGAAFFGNGTHPAGVLTTEAKLTDEQIKQMRTQWEDTHQGAGRANKTAILGGGLKWERLTMPLQDAQFLESRRFQILEIARWFRVPPHLLAELDRATHTNIEQEQLAFVTHCLMPWAVRLESECNVKLFGRNQQGRQSVKHNFGALLRGDLKSRYEAYQIARLNGWMNADEIRELEDRNPLPSGEGRQYIVPGNTALMDELEARAERAAEPPAPPAAPQDPQDPAESDADPAARLRLLRS